MTLAITHQKVSAKTDTGDGTLIQPSDWNEDHTIVGAGNSAELDVGSTAGTVAAGDHTHVELEYIELPDVAVVPNLIANGGVLYVENGILKFLAETGVVTVLANP